jgi:hypothetical protein
MKIIKEKFGAFLCKALSEERQVLYHLTYAPPQENSKTRITFKFLPTQLS